MTSILFTIVRICCSRFKGKYVKYGKLFLNFLFRFLNLRPILNPFKKKLIFIAIAFPKLQSVKDLIRPLSKKRRFKTPFQSQHVKVSQTLVKSLWEHLYQIHSTLWGKLIWKTSWRCLLTHWLPMTSILFGIVGICCSRFADTYHKNENLPLNLLFHFSNLRPILNILKKKMIFIAIVFPKLQTLKDMVVPLSKKPCFRTTFENQHVKAPQTFVKSALEHFHHIISSP